MIANGEDEVVGRIFTLARDERPFRFQAMHIPSIG